MQIPASTPEEYVAAIEDEVKKSAIEKLRTVIKKNIPKGFKEMTGYGMLGYSVPHSIYPKGYHCDPKQPLPFVGIAAQKNFVAIYHMGIYASPELLNWFTAEHTSRVKNKLDMGKSCIRYKKPETIPYDLIAELMTKMTVEDWIALYEKNYLNSRKSK